MHSEVCPAQHWQHRIMAGSFIYLKNGDLKQTSVRNVTYIKHTSCLISHLLGPLFYSSHCCANPIICRYLTLVTPCFSHFLSQGFFVTAGWDACMHLLSASDSCAVLDCEEGNTYREIFDKCGMETMNRNASFHLSGRKFWVLFYITH